MKDNLGVDPTIFCLSSVIVGMLSTNDLSYPELNAIGNWLVLLGDYLLTYAAQEYVVELRTNQSNNKDNLDYLYDALKKMQAEIEKIKKETH